MTNDNEDSDKEYSEEIRSSESEDGDSDNAWESDKAPRDDEVDESRRDAAPDRKSGDEEPGLVVR